CARCRSFDYFDYW
nr:immunoglobulin heavy chain junction region [Mus musculus]